MSWTDVVSRARRHSVVPHSRQESDEPAFLHASHNLFMQQIFTPRTSDTGWTVYVVGDLGAAFVGVTSVVAFIFWRRRSAVPMPSA
jgi:hypothetical protein